MLIFLLPYKASAQIVMRFQPHITTHAHQLGDLLLITGDKDNLAKMPLDSQPRANQKITKLTIINWIKQKRGVFAYTWKGKKTATIYELTKTKGIDLLAKAQSSLKNQLEKQEYTHVELATKVKLKDSRFPLSAFKIQIPAEYPVAKHLCVRMSYKKQSIPVWFTVKAYQKVLVAQHKIKNQTTANDQDFILKTRNIAGLKDKPVNKLPQRMWLNKSINTNQILTQSHLSDIPEVIKGQKIQITVFNQGISIVTEAIALNNGSIGQSVQMKNPKTNKYFFAVITAVNQAEITS